MRVLQLGPRKAARFSFNASIQESSTEVSKAIQLSVEDLTSEYDVENSRLKEYLEQARKKGINEINIIDNDGEIINSSDPALVGKMGAYPNTSDRTTKQWIDLFERLVSERTEITARRNLTRSLPSLLATQFVY